MRVLIVGAGVAGLTLAAKLLQQGRTPVVVEQDQKDSRRLSKYIFVEHKLTAWGRDEVVKHYPMAKMIGDIIDAMHTPF